MPTPPQTAWGERIYAIGDMHGHLDLLSELMTLIQLDTRGRKRRRTRLIILGNFIDRGPNAAEITQWLYRIALKTKRIVVLRGEREQIMAQALRGNLEVLDEWIPIGGASTLASWGVPQETLNGPLELTYQAARRLIPYEISHWLSKLPLSYQSGDYFFVHSGIRPGVPLRDQAPRDLLQIEDEFLDDDRHHPAIIVHGHSFCDEEPELLPNRIAVNTGAFKTRRLSAVGLEGLQRWTLTT